MTTQAVAAEAISCLVHYRGDAQAYDLSLRITVRPSWFARTTRAALLGPFCDAYNRKVKGGPALDPFAARLAAADGSVVGGGEGVGAVVRAVQELFVVGRDYCFHRTWRDRDLEFCGRSAELALPPPPPEPSPDLRSVADEPLELDSLDFRPPDLPAPPPVSTRPSAPDCPIENDVATLASLTRALTTGDER